MVKINILAVGSVKEDYISKGVNEYLKRLSRFAEVKIFEISEAGINEKNTAKIIKTESERVLKRINSGAPGASRPTIIVLSEEGQSLYSVELAAALKKYADKGEELTFIIGGSNGLGENVKEKADMLLSLSKMTFPHTMARLILTEQLYRAFMINAGSAYHK